MTDRKNARFRRNRPLEIALARAVRLAAEQGTPFEELLSRSPRLESRLLALTLARVEGRSSNAAADAASATRRQEAGATRGH